MTGRSLPTAKTSIAMLEGKNQALIGANLNCRIGLNNSRFMATPKSFQVKRYSEVAPCHGSGVPSRSPSQILAAANPV